MDSMSYTEPKRKQILSLARLEDCQDAEGNPNANIIAAKVGLGLEVTRWILDGMPSLAEPEPGPESPKGKSK